MCCMDTQYEALAQAYDELMYDVEYAAWTDYLVGLLRGKGIYEGALLEYACGTGNITLGLLGTGYDVTALDISGEMLNVARKKLAAHAFRPNLVCADMTEFRLNRPADAAVCACDGVNYILDEDVLDTFFANVYANLKPGGVFLFDISSAYKLSTVLGNDFFYDDGAEQTLFWQNRYDAETMIQEMELTLFIAQGDEYERADERHVQRAWKKQEIINALERAGFIGIESYAFMEKRQPQAQAERIQFAAQKGNE